MNLQELGLSKNEEQVFRTLVQHGRLSANLVSRHSGVSYGKIYEVLSSLQHKGFVKLIPEKTKIFVPSDPQALLDILDKKERRLKELRKNVKELKKTYHDNPEDAVVITRGKHNFPRVLRELKSAETFSYAAKNTFYYTAEELRHYKESQKRGVARKVMGRVDAENIENIKKWQRAGQKIKRFPDFNDVALGITDHEVMLVLLKKNTIMLIRDQGFVNMMKTFFENTYSVLEDVKV